MGVLRFLRSCAIVESVRHHITSKGGTVKAWIKKVIKGALRPKSECDLSFRLYFCTWLGLILESVLGANVDSSGGFALFGTFLILSFLCLTWGSEKLARWVYCDDNNRLGPPDRYLLEATRELDDYLSGEWLKREIDNLRRQCVRHLLSFGNCAISLFPRSAIRARFSMLLTQA